MERVRSQMGIRVPRVELPALAATSPSSLPPVDAPVSEEAPSGGGLPLASASPSLLPPVDAAIAEEAPRGGGLTLASTSPSPFPGRLTPCGVRSTPVKRGWDPTRRRR